MKEGDLHLLGSPYKACRAWGDRATPTPLAYAVPRLPLQDLAFCSSSCVRGEFQLQGIVGHMMDIGGDGLDR